MPIPIIYALIITAIFGIGYGACWSHMTGQVATLDAQIELISRESKNLLVEATEKVEASEQKAIIVNANLEIEHAKNIKIITDNAVNLESARRVWLNNQPRTSCAVSKTDNPRVDKKTDDGGYWLDAGAISERVDGLVQKADRASADHHEVMSWLNSIDKDLIK